ncbi:MAG: YdeI/OmpD-associated family protein, partial [Candidatus Limnocylindria bacterium]
MVRSPTAADVVTFRTAGEFRAWLEGHHGTSSELWVGYYKKGVAKTSITYAASVEEALCFGWIDGITHRIDEEVYATRFTPRTKRSTWSAVNVAKMTRLIRDGRVHPA